MKKILLFVLVCLTAATMYAQHSVKIITKSGESISIAFADRPVLTYEDGYIVIRSEVTGAEVSYPLGDLAGSEVESDDIITGVDAISYGTLSEDVKIYTLNGVLVKTLPAGTEGVMPFNGLKSGAYVIKKGKVTHKVQIK